MLQSPLRQGYIKLQCLQQALSSSFSVQAIKTDGKQGINFLLSPGRQGGFYFKRLFFYRGKGLPSNTSPTN
jgi:hypothetical protein